MFKAGCLEGTGVYLAFRFFYISVPSLLPFPIFFTLLFILPSPPPSLSLSFSLYHVLVHPDTSVAGFFGHVASEDFGVLS